MKPFFRPSSISRVLFPPHVDRDSLPSGLSLRERFAVGAFWSLIGAGISRSLNLVAGVVCARSLGQAGFGQLGMIQSTVGMFGYFAGFGLGLTATKYVAEFREKDHVKTGRILKLSSRVALISGGVMAFLLIILAPILTKRVMAAPQLAVPLALAAGMLFFSAMNGAQTGALSGFEAFRTIARVNLFAGLTSFPLIVIGVRLLGLKGAVCGLVISLAFNWFYNRLALRKECIKANIPIKVSESRLEWPMLWKFSLPAYLSAVIVGPVNWACFALLVNQTNGYAEMGIYNAANQWRLIIEFLPSNLSAIGLPLLTNLLSAGDSIKRRKVLSYNFTLGLSIISLGVILSVLFRSQILGAYGPSFKAGGSVLLLLLFVSIPCSVNNAIGQLIVSEGKIWWRFFFDLLLAVFLVLFSVTFIPKLLARGLALSTLLAFSAQAGLLALWRFTSKTEG
jgi:O-antigen/teichoic acid export membrane protein